MAGFFYGEWDDYLKRIYKVTVRLSYKERETLRKHVQSTGLSQEEYLRTLIEGYVPRASPSEAFHAILKELHAIGNSLNQIAQKAHTISFVDASEYKKNVQELQAQTLRIYAAVAAPERIAQDGNNKNMARPGQIGECSHIRGEPG